MKHPTDEEIEKEAIRRFPDMNINHEYSWGKREGFIECGKWARDQQPKLKPMPWEFDKAFDVWRASTAVGEYRVRESLNRVVLPGPIFLDCTDVDHGKQLAQSDYERRINEIYI